MAAAACQRLLQVGTKIVAVGRNYAEHAKELGNAVPKVSIFSVWILGKKILDQSDAIIIFEILISYS